MIAAARAGVCLLSLAVALAGCRQTVQSRVEQRVEGRSLGVEARVLQLGFEEPSWRRAIESTLESAVRLPAGSRSWAGSGLMVAIITREAAADLESRLGPSLSTTVNVIGETGDWVRVGNPLGVSPASVFLAGAGELRGFDRGDKVSLASRGWLEPRHQSVDGVGRIGARLRVGVRIQLDRRAGGALASGGGPRELGPVRIDELLGPGEMLVILPDPSTRGFSQPAVGPVAREQVPLGWALLGFDPQEGTGSMLMIRGRIPDRYRLSR